MVKVLLQKTNVLFLDEPTNHLDIESKDVLLKALQQFPGTILFVSHDHSFLNGLASRILELSPNGIRSYSGNFESYHYQKQQEELLQENNQQPSIKKQSVTPVAVQQQKTATGLSGKQLYKKKKKITSIERKFDTMEKKQIELAQKLGSLDYGSPDFIEVSDQIEQIKKKLAQEIVQWEELNKELKKNSSYLKKHYLNFLR